MALSEVPAPLKGGAARKRSDPFALGDVEGLDPHGGDPDLPQSAPCWTDSRMSARAENPFGLSLSKPCP